MSRRYDPMASVDEMAARFDPDARIRVAKRKLADQLEEQFARNAAALSVGSVPARPIAPALVPTKRRSKGTAENTLNAVRAITMVVYGERNFPRTAANLTLGTDPTAADRRKFAKSAGLKRWILPTRCAVRQLPGSVG
jgi:hypothetical protein